MSDDRPKRDSMSIEEATVSNMWEIAAIVELLERKGLCTKHDIYDIITGIRRKNPRARIILELLNKHGLTSHQSMNLLKRLGGIIEIEQCAAKGTTH